MLPALAAGLVGMVARRVVADWPIAAAGVVATSIVGATYVVVAFRTRVAEVDELVVSLAPRLGPFGRVLVMWRARLRRRARTRGRG